MLKNKHLVKLSLATVLIWILVSSSSCVVSKKSVYFNNVSDTTNLQSIIPTQFVEPTIQADDIVSIVIQTIDPKGSDAVNQSSVMPAVGASSATTVGTQVISGFLVDKHGYVSIPILGDIMVGGLTTYEAKNLLKIKASRFYKDPTVQVRFANYKITVIGEVARPATYTVPNEKVTLLDALGLAGDLTIYGKRENVMLIRDVNDRKEFVRFNLNSTDIFKSPYFYLKQNDVIYVEPGKGKVAANNAARTQIFAIAGTILSVILVAVSRF